jgi:hypothetical protein
MIHNVISAISYRLDEHLKNKLSISETAISVNSLVDIKGNINQEIENKISVFLLNIEEEKISKNANHQHFSGSNPPVSVNIFLMFSAYFPNSNYLEALRYISLVIDFFQSNNNFNSSNTPGLPANIDRLSVELNNISLDEISKLWGNIGANYIPSVSYKVKQITFDGNMIDEIIPKILGN